MHQRSLAAKAANAVDADRWRSLNKMKLISEEKCCRLVQPNNAKMPKSTISKAIKIVHKSLFIQLDDINKTSMMSSLVLSVCLVDILSGFYCGFEGKGGRHKNRFNKFTKEFLPEYSNVLHNLRNSLVHSFSNKDLNFMFVSNPEWFDAFPNVGIFLQKEIFNAQKFKDAINSAFEEYFDRLGEVENNNLRANFMKRYKALGIIKDSGIVVMRNMNGQMVSDINKMDKMPGTNIPFGLVSKLNVKN